MATAAVPTVRTPGQFAALDGHVQDLRDGADRIAGEGGVDVRAGVVGKDDVARGVDPPGQFGDRDRQGLAEAVEFAVGRAAANHEPVAVADREGADRARATDGRRDGLDAELVGYAGLDVGVGIGRSRRYSSVARANTPMYADPENAARNNCLLLRVFGLDDPAALFLEPDGPDPQ